MKEVEKKGKKGKEDKEKKRNRNHLTIKLLCYFSLHMPDFYHLYLLFLKYHFWSSFLLYAYTIDWSVHTNYQHQRQRQHQHHHYHRHYHHHHHHSSFSLHNHLFISWLIKQSRVNDHKHLLTREWSEEYVLCLFTTIIIIVIIYLLFFLIFYSNYDFCFLLG